MKKELCIVIVTYKRDSILNTIKSISNQTVLPQSIILIDNYVYSDLESKIMNFKDLNFTYLKQKENIGASEGYNLGIKKAYDMGFDYVYMLDDDIVLDKKCIQNLLNFEKKSNDVVLASIIVDPNNYVQIIHHKILDENLNQRSVFSKSIKYSEVERPFYEIDANASCGLLVPRKIIEKVGYPDKDYFIWYDDLDYTYRISRNFKIYLVVSSVIFHLDNTYDKNNKIKIENIYKVYYGIRNSIIFKLSYLPLKKKINVILDNFLYILKLIFSVIINREDNMHKRIKAIIYGFIDGVFNIKKRRYLPYL